MVEALASEAVRLYTSIGRSPFPHSDPEAVRRVGGADGAGLLRYVEETVSEMFRTFPLSDVGDAGLVGAMELVEVGMAARHPELDESAVKALAWMWVYSAQK